MVYYDYEEYKNRCGVYMLFCKATHKVYIGSTNTTFKDRQQGHFSQLKNHRHNKLIQADYDIYGRDSFEFIIVFITDDSEEAKRKEEALIKYYMAIKMCYNVVPFGIITGSKATELTKKKMSESRKGQRLTEYQKEKLLEANKARKRTDEEKRHLSEFFAGSKSNFAILNEQQVAEIKTKLIQGVSVNELADEYGVKPICIKNIKYGSRWKHVIVEGWNEYRDSIPKFKRVPEEIREAAAEDLKNGMLLTHVAKKYHISHDSVSRIKRDYNID